MKVKLDSIQSINVILPEEVEFNIQQYYDCLITMTDMVMHLHNLGWFVVIVSDGSIILQHDFGTDGSELLINITIEV